jgi:hypothetical protein
MSGKPRWACGMCGAEGNDVLEGDAGADYFDCVTGSMWSWGSTQRIWILLKMIVRHHNR